MDAAYQTGDSVRDKSRQLIHDALKAGGSTSGVSEQDVQAISAEIEEAVFDVHNRETHNEYRHSIRSRIFNLKDKNNPLLTSSVLTREITPVEFAQMSSEDMASPQRRQENIRLRRNSLTQTVGVNDRRPVTVPDDDVPGEPGMDEMGRSGQRGVEYQRTV